MLLDLSEPVVEVLGCRGPRRIGVLKRLELDERHDDVLVVGLD